MAEQPVPFPRKWYQKKRYLIPSGLLAFVIILGVIGTSSPAPAAPTTKAPAAQESTVMASHVDGAATQEVPAVHALQQPTATPQVKAAGMVEATPTATSVPTQPATYYTNISGNQVQSPTLSNTVPAGASAQCRDGTYSFSQHRSGTCSHHGGVAEWLN